MSDRFVRIFAASLIRISVLLFYLSIFNVDRAFRWAVYVILTITGLLSLAFLIITVAFCRPFIKNLVPETPGTCGDAKANAAATPTVTLLLDLAVVVLPVPIVLRMHMNRRKKLRVLGLFAISAM